MAAFTAGELQVASFRAEASFGTIQTGAMTIMGLPVSYGPTTDMKGVYTVIPGSLSFGDYHSEAWEMGFKASMLIRTALWKAFYALYAMGATTGTTTGHLDSFSSKFDIFQTTHNYDIYSGCMINTLKISASKPGAEILYDIDVFAQYQYPSRANSVLNTLQNVTTGAAASDPATALVRWTTPVYANIGGAGASLIYPEKWSILVDNHLRREPGNITGYDEAEYQIPIAIHQGERDIILEMTLLSKDRTWANARINGTVITTVQFTIDGDTVTLTTGYIEPNNFPETKQEINTETVRIKFKSIVIS
jgi:hypothetical protein